MIEFKTTDILVVEDNEMIQYIVEETLGEVSEAEKINIIFATTKEKAMKLLQTQQFMSVLLDGDLGNGFSESFDVLAEVLRTQKHIIDIISISGDTDIRRFHLASGATKQIPKEQIVKQLDTIISNGISTLHEE